MTTTSRRLVQAAAMAAVAAMLATACGGGGNDNSSSSASSSSNGGSSSAGPTGSLIKIGVIGSNSGSQASSCDQGNTVGPAWASWVNANGGLNGHRVQVISVDDAGDPAKAQAAEKQLVDGDQVLAIVVSCDNLISAYAADAKAKGVPLVSGPANQSPWYSQAGTFVTPTDVASGLIDQMMVAKQYAKATKFANLYCQEVAACGQAIALQQPKAATIGIGYTSLAVSSTATSYTPSACSCNSRRWITPSSISPPRLPRSSSRTARHRISTRSGARRSRPPVRTCWTFPTSTPSAPPTRSRRPRMGLRSRPSATR